MPGHAETDMWTTKGTTFGSVGKLPRRGSAASHWAALRRCRRRQRHPRARAGSGRRSAAALHAHGHRRQLRGRQGSAGCGDRYLWPRARRAEAAQHVLVARGCPPAITTPRSVSIASCSAGTTPARTTWAPWGTTAVRPGRRAARRYVHAAGRPGTPRCALADLRQRSRTSTRRRAACATQAARWSPAPWKCPGGDWVVVFTDPQGAAVAAHQLKPAVSPPPPPPAAPAEKSAVSTEVANEVKKVARKVAAVAAEVGSTLQRAARRTAAAVKKATKKTAAKKPAAKKAKKKAPVSRAAKRGSPRRRGRKPGRRRKPKPVSRRASPAADRAAPSASPAPTARRGTRSVRRAKRARRAEQQPRAHRVAATSTR